MIKNNLVGRRIQSEDMLEEFCLTEISILTHEGQSQGEHNRSHGCWGRGCLRSHAAFLKGAPLITRIDYSISGGPNQPRQNITSYGHLDFHGGSALIIMIQHFNISALINKDNIPEFQCSLLFVTVKFREWTNIGLKKIVQKSKDMGIMPHTK